MNSEFIVVIIVIILIGVVVHLTIKGGQGAEKVTEQFVALADGVEVDERQEFIREILSEAGKNKFETSEPYSYRGQYFLLFKFFLEENGIDEEKIKQYYLKEYNYSDIENDDTDKLLLYHMYQLSEENLRLEVFPEAVNEALLELLSAYNIAYSTDWRYDDIDVYEHINPILERFNYEVSFAEHNWNEPFTITLRNKSDKTLISTEQFSYKDIQNREQTELIKGINRLLVPRNLEFIHSDSGQDNYRFILFDKNKYDEYSIRFGENFQKIIHPY